MKNEYTAVLKQEGDWWIGWIEEIPGVNCQERTYEELKETLAVARKKALEFNRRDVLKAVGSGYTEEKIALRREANRSSVCGRTLFVFFLTATRQDGTI